MSQPKWKTIYTTDSERLLVDETGVYPPELEVADEVFDAPAKERFIVFRVPLDKLKLVPGSINSDKLYLVPDRYKSDWPHPLASYEEWFAAGKNLEHVASSHGHQR